MAAHQDDPFGAEALRREDRGQADGAVTDDRDADAYRALSSSLSYDDAS
ncbi:MAG: hypothetical protein QOH97_5804 [Actinoplanes sp.]|nr:hypothetical protein [Actinoplanes sp.]